MENQAVARMGAAYFLSNDWRRCINQTILGPTYVIAGGYTAGHLTPGMAVAETLRVRCPDLKVLFVGPANHADAEFIVRFGLPYLALPSAPWADRGFGARSKSFAAVWPAAWMARRRFRTAGAVGLLCLGGFPSVAPALAARALGLSVTVFEPNACFGLANRLIRPLSVQVLASRLFDTRTLPGSVPRTVVGVPLRSGLRALAGKRPPPPSGPTHLLVLGGSLGDPFLNERAPGLAAQLVARGVDLRVTHQCGRSVDPAAVRAAYERVGVRVSVESFFDPIAPILGASHFVLTAAGAVTLHEVAAAGIPLLVVPLGTAAAAHQHANAEVFQKATGCLRCVEESWEEGRLADSVASLLCDPASWLNRSRDLQDFARNDSSSEATARIVDSLPVQFRNA